MKERSNKPTEQCDRKCGHCNTGQSWTDQHAERQSVSVVAFPLSGTVKTTGMALNL